MVDRLGFQDCCIYYSAFLVATGFFYGLCVLHVASDGNSEQERKIFIDAQGRENSRSIQAPVISAA